MNTYFFTFGQVHTDPESGELLKDYYLEVQAPNAEAATDYMIGRFGYNWSNMYSPRQVRKDFYPKGRYGEVIEIHALKTS